MGTVLKFERLMLGTKLISGLVDKKSIEKWFFRGDHYFELQFKQDLPEAKKKAISQRILTLLTTERWKVVEE